ncbi:MAG TPA: ectonucleotide pyrophosphatase/phosphodiesterase [Terriglobia bacterium]
MIPALAALGLVIASELPARGSGRHVLVVSVDGMSSSYYMNPPAGLRIPNIHRLMAEGSFAEAVEGVYPTLTYPSHTTLVTGRLPAEHGIYTNLSSRVPGKNPQDWFWFAKAIKVPTLWDEARAHHLTTASVAWPVTVGAPIDWDVPEIWNPAKGQEPNLAYVARFVNPITLLEAGVALGLPRRGSEDDGNRTRVASYFFARHEPNLTLLHLEALDAAEHDAGPRSPAANAALERVDVHIGELLGAVKQADLERSTDVFVVSDHGFLSIDRVIRPNTLLVKAGLLTANSKGEVTGGKITTVVNDGSFFIYWPQDSDFRAQIDAALKPLCDQGLVWAVFDQQALHEMAADPDARLALEAPAGAEFEADASEPVVRPLDPPGGTHGYLPYRLGLESSFIAWGPDIKSGVDLHRIRLTEVGPTILEAMGIHDPKFGDNPPLDVIFKTQPEAAAAQPGSTAPTQSAR